MVGRISPQTPEPGSHQHCSESPRAACYSLPTLFAARTKQLTPSSAPRGANISPVLSSFRILPVATGVYPASFPRFRRSDLRTCQLFCLPRLGASLPSFASSRPLFSVACSLFLQNTRGGVCPQTLRLKSTRCRLFACARPPLSGPGEGRAQRTTHYPPLTTHFPVPPHSVLNSRLSCPEAGQP